MTTFNSSDIIFATVLQHGRMVASLRLSGISSMADVLHKLRSVISASMGLVTLCLRNGSQGWVRRLPLLLNKEAVRRSVPAMK